MTFPDLWPLPIFPEGSLASSIITTVWVGVMVVCFFNLRFGWVLSGLVVPGYMVPLWMIKPWAALVTTLEGVLTYAVVWVLSERLSRLGLWSSFFGRDRFFAILLVAVGVRLGVDSLLLPELAQWLGIRGYGALDYQNSLQSVGLVVAALIANQLWKPGLVRGSVPLVVTTVLTWVLIELLILTTNFSIGSLHYLYEDFAGSIEASPKFYILLLATALAASRLNLNYSWDFNGIMVPALLTLQWYQPEKIVSTLVEAWVILVLARLVLQTRWLARTNLEGARKLLLFFNIGFAYKFVLGFTLPLFGFDGKISDAFAYGYLLSTLLAMRMHDKNYILQLPRVVLQTSLIALAGASLLGYALTQLHPETWFRAAVPQPVLNLHAAPDVMSAQQRLYEQLIAWHEAEAQEQLVSVGVPARERLTVLAAALATAKAKPAMQDANWQIEAHGTETVLSGRSGLGATYFAAHAQPRDHLLWLLADGDDFPGMSLAARRIYTHLHSAGLAVVGDPAAVGKYDALPVEDFLQGWGKATVIRLRYAPELTRARLRVCGQLPADLDLRRLSQLLGEPQIEFVTEGVPLLLELPAAALAQALLVSPDSSPAVASLRLEGGLDLQTLRAATGGAPWQAVLGSGAYIAPTPGELWLLQQQVLAPLTAGWGKNDAAQEATLRRAQGFAHALGYRYLWLKSGGDRHLLLLPDGTQPHTRYWGTYLFHGGRFAAVLIEAPYNDSDDGLLSAALDWYVRMPGAALLISGADPLTNQDGSADVTRPSNRASLFNGVHKAVLDHLGTAPLLVMQLRSAPMSLQAGATDVVIAFQRGIEQRAAWPAPVRNFMRDLDALGLRWAINDGSSAFSGYEAQITAQSNYLGGAPNASYASVYLSAERRRDYRPVADASLIAALTAVGITTDTLNLVSEYSNQRVASHALPESARKLVQRYLMSHDIQLLDQLHRQHVGWHWRFLIDSSSGIGLLAAFDGLGRMGYAVNLSSPSDQVVRVSMGALLKSGDLEPLIARRAAVILVGSP